MSIDHIIHSQHIERVLFQKRYLEICSTPWGKRLPKFYIFHAGASHTQILRFQNSACHWVLVIHYIGTVIYILTSWADCQGCLLRDFGLKLYEVLHVQLTKYDVNLLSCSLIVALGKYENKKIFILFLVLHQNICCGYLLESSYWGPTKHLLWGKIIATDKALFSSEKCWCLSYFSTKTYVVGTH